MPNRLPCQAATDLYARTFSQGFKMADVCRKAGIRPSTWSTIARGADPRQSTLDKLNGALDELVAERTPYGPPSEA